MTMKRVKRDREKRAYKLGYTQGLRGHSARLCPFYELTQRGQWMGGWRKGHAAHVAGYEEISKEKTERLL